MLLACCRRSERNSPDIYPCFYSCFCVDLCDEGAMESSVVLWSDTRDVQIWSVVSADADDVESLQEFCGGVCRMRPLPF